MLEDLILPLALRLSVHVSRGVEPKDLFNILVVDLVSEDDVEVGAHLKHRSGLAVVAVVDSLDDGLYFCVLDQVQELEFYGNSETVSS